MNQTQAKAHPSDPPMNDIELFMANSREQSDYIRLAGQSKEDRSTGYGHQAGSNCQGWRAKSTKLTIIRSHREGQYGQKESEEEKGCEQSV